MAKGRVAAVQTSHIYEAYQWAAGVSQEEGENQADTTEGGSATT